MARPRFFYGWVIVAIGFVSLGLGYSIWYSFTVFFLAVLQEFGWSRADTALAFSVFVVVHGLSGPPTGMLIERFGLRRVMPLGALFLAAALVACSQISAPWQYYLTFGILTSVGVNTVGVIPNYSALNRWFVRRRGFVIGLASAGIGALGILTLVPLNQYFISTIGWRSTYLVLAALIALVLPPLTYLFQRDRPQDLGLLPDGLPTPSSPVTPAAALASSRPARPSPASAAAKAHLPSGDAVSVDRRWSATDWTVGRAMRTWRFWALFVVFFMGPVANQTVFVHVAPYFVDLGHGEFVAASVIGLVGLVSVAGKVGWGLSSDRLGREFAYTLGVSCMVVGLVLLLLMPIVPDRWLLYVFGVFFALGYSVYPALNPAIAGDLFTGRHFAVIYGTLSIAGNVGAALGTWLAGYMFDVGGSYAPAFYISIASTILAGLGVWLVAPRRFRPTTIFPFSPVSTPASPAVPPSPPDAAE